MYESSATRHSSSYSEPWVSVQHCKEKNERKETNNSIRGRGVKYGSVTDKTRNRKAMEPGVTEMDSSNLSEETVVGLIWLGFLRQGLV